MRSWLVVAEISLSVFLLAGASLAIRGFVQCCAPIPDSSRRKCCGWT